MSAGLIGSPSPLSGYDLLLFDLDGVVYIGPQAVPGAPEAVERAHAAGVRCTFVTNNASRRPGTVARHLRDLGIDAADDDVVTSAQAGAALLARRLPSGANVLVVGGDGLTWALEQAGLKPVTSMDDEPQAVIQGFAPEVGWRQLAEASYAITAGLPWVATNRDLTVPTPRGRAPGNGSLVNVLADVTGRQPENAGKPEPTLFREAVQRCRGTRPLVVGDRLDTDLEGARAAGIDGLLVLTGVHRARELLVAQPPERPHLIARDLHGLDVPHPGPVRTDGGWQVGGATVSDRFEVLSPGDDALDVLRAACCAAWATRAGEAPGNADVDAVLSALRRLEADGPWGR